MAAAVRSMVILLVVVALAVSAAFAWSPASSLAGGAGGLHHLRLEEVALGGPGSGAGAGGARGGRVLAAGKDKNGYLSYFAAMRRDSVPCSRRGSSYYNCLPGAPASPYNRSCAHITRCHG